MAAQTKQALITEAINEVRKNLLCPSLSKPCGVRPKCPSAMLAPNLIVIRALRNSPAAYNSFATSAQAVCSTKRNWQKLSLRLLYREAARKTIQNSLAGSLLTHRQRPHPRLVPSTRRPTPECAAATTWPISTRLLASWVAVGLCRCSKKPR